MGSSTPQSSVGSSVVVVERANENKYLEETLEGTSKVKYLERLRNLDLKEFAWRKQLMEVQELRGLSHEDLNSHYCVEWLKVPEVQFSRETTRETAELKGVQRRVFSGSINYRPLNELRSSGAIAEPPKHSPGLVRLRVAILAVEKFLDLKAMGLPDTVYVG